MGKNLTVLVCSNDMNEDLWDPFFSLIQAYWKDCPYQFVLNTPTKLYHRAGIDIRCPQLFPPNSESEPFGKRLIACLKEIDSQFILFMLDDHFIGEDVSTSGIKKIINWMEQDSGIACFNLSKYGDEFNISDKKYEGYIKRSRYGTYRFNASPAIWRRDALIRAWKEHESIWEWEAWGNMRSWKEEIKVYIPEPTCRPPIVFSGGDAIIAGKWAINNVDRVFKENNIQIDYEKRGVVDAVEPKRAKRLNSLKSVGLLRFLDMCMFYLINALVYKGKSPLLEYSNRLNKRYYFGYKYNDK